MTMPMVDLWFEFASTYSYPAAMRLAPLAKEVGVIVRWRPFMLGPIFKAQGWNTSPFNLYPAKGRNMWRDLERICLSLDLPFVRPKSFPQNTLQATRVALVGLAESWGEDYCRAIYRALAMLERAQSDEVKSQLRAHTEQAQRLDIFGSPSFVTADGELFWGNDRLEAALSWAAAR